MKKLFLSLIFIISLNSVIFADENLPVDDSTPYMPYPERIEIIKEVPVQPAPKTQTKQTDNKSSKKTTRKKTTTAKKKTKTTVKKITSLERGIALMKEERYEAAKPYLQKAVQEERNNPNAWYWYGVYHEKTGKFSQAQYFYSKAVTIDPTLEPLSRVVYYPNDDEKTPLWDPKRPARVYPVSTKNDGLVIGSGNFPKAPNDPEIPRVPVYVPPEPGSNPTDGDKWAPALYVPPAPSEFESGRKNADNALPVYTPPQPNNVQEIYAYEIPGYSNTYVHPERSDVRADAPLYNPPEPGKIVSQAPKEEIKEARPAAAKKISENKNKNAPRKIVKKSAPAKKQNTSKKQAAKENKKTEVKQSPQVQQVRQTQPKKQTNEPPKVKPETKQTKQEVNKTTKAEQKAEPVKPQPKTQAAQQTQQNAAKKEQPKKINKSEKTEVPEPSVKSENKTKATPEKPKKVEKVETNKKTEKAETREMTETTETIEKIEKIETVTPPQPVRKNIRPAERKDINQDLDLPPVGQSAPDPGTIVESEFPPVGQGN